MNKFISLGIVSLGVLLVSCGLDESDSIASRFFRFFTSTPTDRTVWLMIGGVIVIGAGLTGLARPARSS